MKKRIISTLIAIIMVALCIGCGSSKSPDGEWTHTKSVLDDGSVFDEKDLEPEFLVINGETAHYTCDSSFLKKKVEFDLSVMKNDDGTYTFNLIGSDNDVTDIAFMENVELKGNTMRYYMDGVEYVYTRR